MRPQARQALDVPAGEVHHYRLRHVIEVVAGGQAGASAFPRLIVHELPPEHPAVGAGAGVLRDRGHLVHAQAHLGEGPLTVFYALLRAEILHDPQAGRAVSRYAFIQGYAHEADPVPPTEQLREDAERDHAVLPAGHGDADGVPALQRDLPAHFPADPPLHVRAEMLGAQMGAVVAHERDRRLPADVASHSERPLSSFSWSVSMRYSIFLASSFGGMLSIEMYIARPPSSSRLISVRTSPSLARSEM